MPYRGHFKISDALFCFSSKSEMVHLLLSELEFTADLIWTFPGHEVVWYHR